MAILLGMVTYLDRASLGNLDGSPMMGDLGLSQYQLSYAHHRLCPGLWDVRDPQRLVGRPDRHAARC